MSSVWNPWNIFVGIKRKVLNFPSLHPYKKPVPIFI